MCLFAHFQVKRDFSLKLMLSQLTTTVRKKCCVPLFFPLSVKGKVQCTWATLSPGELWCGEASRETWSAWTQNPPRPVSLPCCVFLTPSQSCPSSPQPHNSHHRAVSLQQCWRQEECVSEHEAWESCVPLALSPHAPVFSSYLSYRVVTGISDHVYLALLLWLAWKPLRRGQSLKLAHNENQGIHNALVITPWHDFYITFSRNIFKLFLPHLLFWADFLCCLFCFVFAIQWADFFFFNVHLFVPRSQVPECAWFSEVEVWADEGSRLCHGIPQIDY